MYEYIAHLSATQLWDPSYSYGHAQLNKGPNCGTQVTALAMLSSTRDPAVGPKLQLWPCSAQQGTQLWGLRFILALVIKYQCTLAPMTLVDLSAIHLTKCC